MDLRTGKYYWLEKDGEMPHYPPLDKNQTCEIAIIGGGITAAIMAYKLSSAGYECLVLDKREICKGSTLASTAIIQYEIDKPLAELQTLIGEKNAALAYKLCYQAVIEMESLANEIGEKSAYTPSNSLYIAKSPKDIPLLQKEYELRKALNFEVEYIEQEDIERYFSFTAPAALYSSNAGVSDCYLFAHRLFEKAKSMGCRIYGESGMTEYKYTNGLPANRIEISVENKYKVTARHAVFCTGYESQSILKEKVVNLISTYAITTKKLRNTYGWRDQAIIWETGWPYFYIRHTSEGHAMIGGCDKIFRNAFLRDLMIPFISRKLINKFNSFFPEIHAETGCCWAGTFGETKDSLAYIGPSPEYPGAFFALGFGGNGMTFSIIAAALIFDFLDGKKNEALELFRFGR